MRSRPTKKPLFKLTAVSIAANILTATLAAGQSAFIRGAAVTAESLTIDASFNDDRLIGYQLGDAGIFITTLQNHGALVGTVNVGGVNYTVYQYNDRDYYVNAGAVYVRPGAIANLGGNGASGSGTADVSLVSASVDTAVATADTSSMAYLDGGTIIVTNDLVVRNAARSLAEALITNDSFNLGLIGMGMALMYANADGDYRSYIKGGSVRARGVLVETRYYTNARAKTTQPSAGANVTGISVETNIATAVSGTEASAMLSGNGDITATGLLSRNTSGQRGSRFTFTRFHRRPRDRKRACRRGRCNACSEHYRSQHCGECVGRRYARQANRVHRRRECQRHCDIRLFHV